MPNTNPWCAELVRSAPSPSRLNCSTGQLSEFPADDHAGGGQEQLVPTATMFTTKWTEIFWNAMLNWAHLGCSVARRSTAISN